MDGEVGEGVLRVAQHGVSWFVCLEFHWGCGMFRVFEGSPNMVFFWVFSGPYVLGFLGFLGCFGSNLELLLRDV